MIDNRLRDADLCDPDLDEQHLSADRDLQDLNRIRQVTFTAGEQTITAIARRTVLQQQSLATLGVDTRTWTRPRAKLGPGGTHFGITTTPQRCVYSIRTRTGRSATLFLGRCRA